MGKQSKRKRQKGRRHAPSLSASAGPETPPSGSDDAVLSKLRHGDPRVRHAALAALSGTIYSGSNGGARASSPSLLRALSERLLDEDVPCAVVAAGCLSNHVSFSLRWADVDADAAESDAGGERETELDVAVQVTIPILLQRIRSSLDSCSELGRKIAEIKSRSAAAANNAAVGPNSAKTAAGADKKSPTDKLDKLQAASAEQWTLQSLSLQTLSGLVENCPRAASRASSALPLLLGVLRRASRCVGARAADGDAAARDAADSAGRALHSLLDENGELISTVPSAVPSVAGGPTVASAVEELAAVVADGSLGDAARLHACGAVLSLRRALLVDRGENATDAEEARIRRALQSCTSDVIVPTLRSLLVVDVDAGGSSYAAESPKALVQRMTTTLQQLSAQRQDEAMESAVVSEINARKEPARMIARRQKEMKQKNQATGAEEKEVKRLAANGMDTEEDEKFKDGGMVIVEDDASKDNGANDNNADGNGTIASTNPSDPKEELETILRTWREVCTSRKLALELVANLCSGPADRDEEGEDGDAMMPCDEEDEHMWDSDDEAKLMAEVGGEQMGDTSPVDEEVFASMAKNHLAEQILLFFKSWVMFVPSVSKEGVDCPAPVVDDVQELLSTCALCLGNMFACELPTWTLPVSEEVGAALRPAADAKNGAELVFRNLVSLLTAPELAADASGSDAVSHVASAMLSLVRHRADARALADASALDELLDLLSRTNGTEGTAGSGATSNDSLTQMHCNIIAILGALCSEPHAASVNARVCAALTEKMRAASNPSNSTEDAKNSVIVLNEAYNVLMDMYGGDDANDEVYAQQDVSGHFTRTLPGFKRSVKKVASTERENGEVGIWNETALNANRFIRFKRGG